jgi:hypothetical protein
MNDEMMGRKARIEAGAAGTSVVERHECGGKDVKGIVVFSGSNTLDIAE